MFIYVGFRNSCSQLGLCFLFLHKDSTRQGRLLTLSMEGAQIIV